MTHKENHNELIVESVADEPLLGLATTEQLIEELAVRMEITQDPRTLAGDGFGALCRDMLRSLPSEVLDYRTVDPCPKHNDGGGSGE